MEDNIILADKMHQTAFVALPPLLPALRKKLLCIGNIADRSVEPDIEHLALCALYGNRDTPVQVAAHGAGLKPAVKPALALAVNI